MSGKLSFTFSNVKKRPALSLGSKSKVNSDIQYITSIEEKKIKLVDPELEVKEKELLVIPLPKSKVLKDPLMLEQMDEACQSNVTTVEDSLNGMVNIPLVSNPPVGEEESSLDDYEEVPIQDFGMAMLRGMGWSKEKGIGKSGKVATVNLPQLRPQGMGLGADKVVSVKESSQRAESQTSSSTKLTNHDSAKQYGLSRRKK